MSLTVKRTTDHELAFIRFCQRVADELSEGTPFWVRNLNRFDKVFTRFVSGGKSHLPILTFIESHRENVERKIIDRSTSNDAWLLVPEGVPEPKASGLAAAEPRGVFLAMKEDDWNCCLPLAEVYSVCVKAQDLPSRHSFDGVTTDSIPARFLSLFYAMLLEADPDNSRLQENKELCEDVITPAAQVPPIGQMMGNLMGGDMAKQMSALVGNLFDAIPDSARDDMQRMADQRDFSGMLQSIGPVIQNSGIGDILKQMMPPPQAQIEDNEGDVEDQE